MSSRELEPAMLIVSRAIYAKRADETFYPGRIETKLPDGSYLVKFADGCSERIEESCITWLGFWGLPPWTWPSNPLVQPASSANWEIFNEHARSISTKDYRPFSRPIRTHEESNERVKTINKFLHLGSKHEAADGMKIGNGDSQELNSFRKNSEDSMPKHASLNQTRTSVIRMCPNSHLKQEDESTKSTFTKRSLQFTDTTPSSNRTSSPSSNEDKKEMSFNGHEIFLQESESLVRKRKVSSSEEFSIKETHFRSENNLRNSLPFHENFPLSTSIPFPSSHLQNYSQPFRFSMYEPSSNPTPTSFRLQTKARRRSENKKCRKVYGIENRNIWCTQCKWKKACSRFSGMEKDDLGGFVYMAEYDDLHLPVVS